jgi:HEAT repeat protein
MITRPLGAIQEIIGDEPPNANAAVVPFMMDLASADVTTRIGATMALRELGPVAWPAIDALVEALSDPIMGIRKGAAGALGGIGPAAESAVPDLIEALADPHRFVRSWAAMALYEIGPAAKPAGERRRDIMQLLRDAQQRDDPLTNDLSLRLVALSWPLGVVFSKGFRRTVVFMRSSIAIRCVCVPVDC